MLAVRLENELELEPWLETLVWNQRHTMSKVSIESLVLIWNPPSPDSDSEISCRLVTLLWNPNSKALTLALESSR